MAEVFLGQIVHSKSFNEFEILTDGFVAIENGQIVGVGDNYDSWKLEWNKDVTETVLNRSQFLMPGFIDCHIHASQMPNIGLGLDKPLLEWLNTYTFPLEANYKDEEFSQKVYEKVVSTTLKHGTTLAVYFATIHKNSTLLLAQECIKQGQRAFIGKVSMDCNCPDFYIENYEDSINDNIELIENVLSLSSEEVQPIITPRFAITCTEKMMKKLSDLAFKYDLHIQSHISENCNEINFVKELFGKSYAQVYYDTGLLSNRTIMAHGVHLEDEELVLFSQTGASIAHCPNSNTSLQSGSCDVKRLLRANIKVGLGTDVSGGYSASMKNALLRAIDVSKNIGNTIAHGIKGDILPSSGEHYDPLDYTQAIYLATLGGAEALSLQDKIGNFKIGKDFDALLVDTSCFPIDDFDMPEAITANKSPEDRLLELVQKFIYVGDDRNIKKVYVKGRIVKE